MPEADALTLIHALRGMRAVLVDLEGVLIPMGAPAPSPGTLRFLQAVAGSGSYTVAVVSTSDDADAVLRAAGIRDLIDVVIDAHVALVRGLARTPSPATLVAAATALGVSRHDCLVVEGTVPGVAAGHWGEFGVVVGVDRGAGAVALLDAGAALVVDDLGLLVEAAAPALVDAGPPRWPGR